MVEESVILKRDGLQILEADSKAVFQLLLIHSLLLFQLRGLFRCFLFCYAIRFGNHLDGEERTGCFYFNCFPGVLRLLLFCANSWCSGLVFSVWE